MPLSSSYKLARNSSTFTLIQKLIALCVLSYLSVNSVYARPQQELSELRQRIQALKKEISIAEDLKSEAADELQESEKAISNTNRNLREILQKQKSIQTKIRDLEAESKKLDSAIRSQQIELADWLHLYYTKGQIDPIKKLLGNEDLNQAARELHYYRLILNARAELIKTLRANLRKKEELVEQAKEEKKQLAEIEKQERAQKEYLFQQQQERRHILTKISAKLKTQRKQLNLSQRNESRLTRLIQGLGKIISDKMPRIRNEITPDASTNFTVFSSLKGKLRLPVIGELLNPFSSRQNSSNEGGKGKGLFIRSPTGKEVKAIARGQIVFADWMRGFGNLMIIDHGENYLSIYGNNEALFKHVGDSVNSGDTIASIGNSGGNTDSGLYFELRHEGKILNLMDWITLKK